MPEQRAAAQAGGRTHPAPDALPRAGRGAAPASPRTGATARSALLPIQRKRAILAILATEREVGTARLAARFGVSTVTIRRDLGQLHEEGRLERGRGGGRPR